MPRPTRRRALLGHIAITMQQQRRLDADFQRRAAFYVGGQQGIHRVGPREEAMGVR